MTKRVSNNGFSNGVKKLVTLGMMAASGAMSGRLIRSYFQLQTGPTRGAVLMTISSVAFYVISKTIFKNVTGWQAHVVGAAVELSTFTLGWAVITGLGERTFPIECAALTYICSDFIFRIMLKALQILKLDSYILPRPTLST